MPTFDTEHDCGELGLLTLSWWRGSLTWEPADRSSGYPAGQWQGTPDLLGADLDGRLILPALLQLVLGPDRMRVLADQAREECPPPAEERASRAEERARMEQEA